MQQWRYRGRRRKYAMPEKINPLESLDGPSLLDGFLTAFHGAQREI
jgi:hypothetical protein